MKLSVNFGWVAGIIVASVALGTLVVLVPRATLIAAAALLGLLAAAHTLRKYLRGRDLVDPAVWSPPLLLFPLVYALRDRGLPILVAGLIFLGLLALMHRPTGATYLRWPSRVAFVAVLPVTFISGDLKQSLATAAVVIGSLCVLLLAVNRTTPHGAVSSLLDGVGLFLVANVGAHYLGIESTGAALRTGGLEAIDGGERIIYPLSESLALPPMLAAVYVSGSILILTEKGWKRALRFLALAAAVSILVGAESRVAIALAVLALVASMLAPRALARAATPVAAVGMAFAFIFPVVFPLIAPVIDSATTAVPGLTRAGQSADTTLNGRSFLWETSIDYWTHVDLERQLLGYGALGHRASGSSAEYAGMFGASFTDPLAITPHNSTLQNLWDAGVVGVVVLSLLGLWGVRRWSRYALANREPFVLSGLMMSVGLVLTGVTEVSLAPGAGQVSVWLFLALVLVAARIGLAVQGREGATLAPAQSRDASSSPQLTSRRM